MRIARLELFGFKSFPERTTFRFGSGVSCVVGPNGCGKSNVVDAIRWVIGEQSAKSLRGGEMLDVIFSGSADRPPVGFAEVNLGLSSDRGEPFPGIYSRLDEMEVGRRLHRSGASEYSINGRRCRRRDVVELFMDTGVGSNLYSFIEQGRIDKIVNASALERRGLIDEAAGISSYKARRAEARRRLEATAGQLDRAADVAEEMGRRLRVLERQVLAAARFRRLRSLLRQGEVCLALAKYAALSGDRSALRARLQAQRGELAATRRAAGRRDEDIQQRRRELSVVDAGLASRRDALAELDGALREVASALQFEERRKVALDARGRHILDERRLALAAVKAADQRGAVLAAQAFTLEQSCAEAARAKVETSRDLALVESTLQTAIVRVVAEQRACNASEVAHGLAQAAAHAATERCEALKVREHEIQAAISALPVESSAETPPVLMLQAEVAEASAALQDAERAAMHSLESAQRRAELWREAFMVAEVLAMEGARAAIDREDEAHEQWCVAQDEVAQRRIVAVTAFAEATKERADTKIEASRSALEEARGGVHRARKAVALVEQRVAEVQAILARLEARREGLVATGTGDELKLPGPTLMDRFGAELSKDMLCRLGERLILPLLSADQIQVLEGSRNENSVRVLLDSPTLEQRLEVQEVNTLAQALDTMLESAGGQGCRRVAVRGTGTSIEPDGVVTLGRDPRPQAELLRRAELATVDLEIERHRTVLRQEEATLASTKMSEEDALATQRACDEALRVLCDQTTQVLKEASSHAREEIEEVRDTLAAEVSAAKRAHRERVARRRRVLEERRGMVQEHLHTSGAEGIASVRASCDADVHRARTVLEGCRGRLEQAMLTHAEELAVRNKASELTRQHDATLKSVARAREEHIRTSQKLTELKVQCSQHQRSMQELQRARDSAEAAMAAARRKHHDAEMAEATLGARTSAIDAQRVEASREAVEAGERVARMETDHSALQREIAQAAVEHVERIQQRESLVCARGESWDALEQERVRHQKLRNNLSEAEELGKTLQSELEAQAVRLAAVEKRVNEVQVEVEVLRRGMADRYQLSLPGLLDRMEAQGVVVLTVEKAVREGLHLGHREVEGVQDRVLRPSDLEDEHKIQLWVEQVALWRVDLARLGQVNLAAIEEHTDLAARFQALDQQRIDLADSVSDIRAAIARMNRECRQRFRDTFDLVNEAFQKSYPRLVGGGSGRLALTDDEDLLEAGVDIFVQPPGKRLQHLNLLSGGEKAMTAIALLLALFTVKPSPFCLLDEVDAPLDEANGVRFNEMLREMSSLSQFVVITHNRKTMECAETLYGVTMSTPGVSRLVSVNLGR